MVQTADNNLADLTLPHLLQRQAERLARHVAMREKYLGIWQSWTWAEVLLEVRALACGLADLGFKRGMNLALIGDNRPRLYWGMIAAQCLGGVPVPLYQDAPADEIAFVLGDAEVIFILAEDQEQVDKLLEVKQNISHTCHLAHIIVDDERGLRHYTQPELRTYVQVRTAGLAYAAQHGNFFVEEIAAGKMQDTAVILYTSGTTGMPKGVCHSHQALIATASNLMAFDRLDETDSILCYLPPAWVGDFLYSFVQTHVTGLCLNCPESPQTAIADFREIGPTYCFAPPRIYENILTQVMIRIENAGWLKRRMFHLFMDLAKRVGLPILEHSGDVTWSDRLLYRLGQLLVYGPLKNVLGLSRLRTAYTGGEAIGPDLFNFYRSIGVNLKQLYGMTETCVTLCMQASGEVKLDTVGKPMAGVKIRIADDGEILACSPGLMQGYFKRLEATRDAIDDAGYFHTGDAGFFDEDGHLKVIDRVRDVGKMLDGTLFSPKYIENKLKFFPFIKEAVAFGIGYAQCTAIINIDMEAVGNWAERRGIAFGGYADLAAQTAVYDLIADCIGKVNCALDSDIALAKARIGRFLILHKELDPDDGELTRTRKVRRRFVAEKYAVLIDALYSGKTSQHIETSVRFEDGRRADIKAEIAIRDVSMDISASNTSSTNTSVRMAA